MKWPKGTAALSVALFGRTFDASHEEEGFTRRGDEEYVVLGAGPVGLWTAVQLKLRLPSAQVKVYEKRSAYVREHMVRLGSDALWWSIGNDMPEMKQIVEVQRSGHGMKLKELEGLLRGAAERLGVIFIERAITGAHQLIEMHPNAAAIIGADGRHSVLRETLFAQSQDSLTAAQRATVSGEVVVKAVSLPQEGAPEPAAAAGGARGRASATALSFDVHRRADEEAASSATSAVAGAELKQEHVQTRVLQHTIYINFKLEGADALKAHNLEGGALQNLVFNAADSVLYVSHHPVRLVVGRKLEDSVSLTAIFFIEASTAASMSSCRKNSARGPGSLAGDDRVPTELSSDVRRYLTQRFGAGAVDLEALQLIYVAIDRYCSDGIAQTHSSTGVFLVGDACFGVPYFRALTNGLKCASTLAQYLAMPGVGVATAVRAYRWYVFRLWQQALSSAEVTGLGSIALGGVVTLGQTLVNVGKEEEDSARLAAEQEGMALAEQGLANHLEEEEEEEEEGGSGGDSDVFGEKPSQWDAMVGGITGKERYEFGDLARAGVKGGAQLIGSSVQTGVHLASGALHGFVSFTGLKL